MPNGKIEPNAKEPPALIDLRDHGQFLQVPALAGKRLAIATTRELMIFANVSTLAPLYPNKPDHYDVIFVPRQSYYTAYCDLHDMAFDKNIVLAWEMREEESGAETPDAPSAD